MNYFYYKGKHFGKKYFDKSHFFKKSGEFLAKIWQNLAKILCHLIILQAKNLPAKYQFELKFCCFLASETKLGALGAFHPQWVG